ncbi:MAG: LysM peptidoglycan-binding domain-containing protein [Hyphomicrobiaceae bacterium]|nr:LysM peptidoglycan-binding domain-containing protein [Hyphomicrobiaceae bacterium]
MTKRFQNSGADVASLSHPGARALLVSAVLALGGCSADLGRFDFPSSNLNARDASSAPIPPEPVRGGSYAQAEPEGDGGRSNYGGGTYTPPRASRPSKGVEVAALPEPARAEPYTDNKPSYSSSSRGSAGYSAPDRTPPQPAQSVVQADRASATGGTIEVQRGDTLYGIARRHGVTVNALMSANGLSSANLKPGQQLRLPGGAEPASAVASRPERSAPVTTAAASPPTDWNGSHTVQTGDSLYGLARQYKVRVSDLQRANGISNPRQLKPGMTLHVPGIGGAGAAPDTPARSLAAAAPRDPVESAPRNIPSTTQPTMINGRQVAAIDRGQVSDAVDRAPEAANKGVQTVAVGPAAVSDLKLRWPARGKVLSGFGQRTDGTHNDGINIAVPQGAEVHAAEEGEIAYAGSELKGYGNLVLIRHDNGWVTAYAHNDTLLVKRGDKVKRGDVVAKAGRTGQVDQPQLHFELRQGSKPIDPLPYLERL